MSIKTPELHPVPVKSPWFHLGIDFVGPINPTSRYNQTLQGMLAKFVQGRKELWDEFLDTCIYAYNTSVHESTTFTPFELMFGRKAFLPIKFEIDDKDPEELVNQFTKSADDPQVVETITNQCIKRLTVARENIKKAQDKQKQIYDRKHAQPNAFTVAEKVLKKDFQREKRAGGKMDTRYVGPYVIVKSINKGIYCLGGVNDHTNIIQKISGAHLKPYKESERYKEHNDSSEESVSSTYMLDMYIQCHTYVRASR